MPSLVPERVGEIQMESVAKRPRQDSDSEGEGEGEPKPVEPLQDVVSGAPMVEVHAHLMEATDLITVKHMYTVFSAVSTGIV